MSIVFPVFLLGSIFIRKLAGSVQVESSFGCCELKSCASAGFNLWLLFLVKGQD